jgi:vacuolar-type H+-ATPase subunit F/Vma7
MGGAIGQVVTPDGAAEALRARLSDRSVALIMLEVSLVERLPQDLYRQAFYSREPEVVALGGAWNVVLRRRIRQVLGADLLAESES